MSVRIAVLISFFIASCNAFGDNATSINQPNINLVFSQDKETAIRLETRTVPLNQILDTVSRKTGAIFHYSVLPVTPVTATCAGATLRQVLECLVAKQLGIVEHKAGKNKPAEFWLLASSLGNCRQEPVILSGKAPTETQLSFEEINSHELPVAGAGRMRQEKSDALVAQLKTAQTIEQKSQTLSELAADGNIGDPKVREALDIAVQDEHPEVRGQALSALANLDKDGASELLARALHDNDASVRLIALDHAGEDIETLKQALADSDSNVREFAAAKLESIGKREENK